VSLLLLRPVAAQIYGSTGVVLPSLYVGRVGLTVPMLSPRQWDQDSNRVSLAGTFIANSTMGANVLRQQIAGLADNPDEPVVPVRWTEDPSIDGYYRVLATRIGSHKASLFGHAWDFAFELERVGAGWRLPGFESIVAYAWAANYAGRASSNAKPWVAVSENVVDLQRTPTTEWACADSSATVLQLDLALTDTVRWAIRPADHYLGAATLRIDDQVIVGHQADNLDPYGWSISNGLIEVQLSTGIVGVAARGDFIVRHRTTGNAWTSWKGWELDINPGLLGFPQLGSATGLRVIRNSPEEVIIRVVAVRDHTGVVLAARETYDVSLRRGANYFTVVAKTNLAHEWRLQRRFTEAGAVISGFGTEGGIQAATPDSDGVTYVAGTVLDITQDLASGKITWDSTDLATVTCCIGGLVAPVASAVTEDAARLLDRYFTAQGETVRPVVW
jgi:hypothetical protein